MKLLNNQLDKSSLANFGQEACRLFMARDFRGLADTFGYAFAGNWDVAAAIEADFDRCLSGRSCQDARVESVTVKYCQPNDPALVAVVECVVAVGQEGRLLIELIVANNGDDTNLYLEDVNAVA